MRWSKSVAGTVPSVPCPHGDSAAAEGYPPAVSSPVVAGYAAAYRPCDEAGRWGAVDDDVCQYAAEVTRVLQQYAKVNPNRFCQQEN